MYCTKCGNEVTGANFCSICGSPVVGVALQPGDQIPQPVFQQPPPAPQTPQPGYVPQQPQNLQPQPGYQQQQPVFQQQQPVYQPSQPDCQQQQPVFQQPQPGYQTPQPVYQQPQPGYQQQLQGGNYQDPQNIAASYHASDSFVGRLHAYGGSTLFLVGIILFAAGNIISTLIGFTATSIFTLLLLALPVIGLFLIFAASKTPKLPEKTLPALTLFKVYIIIELVAVGIVALYVLIAFGSIIGMSTDVVSSSTRSLIGIIFFLGAIFILLAAFIAVFFSFVLKLLGRIRSGITNNSLGPIPGIKAFTVLAYISVGINILTGILEVFAYSILHSMIFSIPYDLLVSFSTLLQSSVFSFIAILVTSAGVVIFLIVLNQFNKSLAHTGYR